MFIFIFFIPGNQMAFGFSSAVLFYSFLPLALFDAKVVFPRKRTFADLETRWRYFGLFLFGSGAILRLIAAIIDLR